MKQPIFRQFLLYCGLITLQDETVENPDMLNDDDDYFGFPMFEDYLVEILLKESKTDERIDRIKSGIEHNVTSDEGEIAST